MSIWYGKIQASEMLGISEATLWSLKNTGELQAGKHWLFATGKKASNVLFNVELIREWQIEQTKIIDEAPKASARKIATYQQMGGGKKCLTKKIGIQIKEDLFEK